MTSCQIFPGLENFTDKSKQQKAAGEGAAEQSTPGQKGNKEGSESLRPESIYIRTVKTPAVVTPTPSSSAAGK